MSWQKTPTSYTSFSSSVGFMKSVIPISLALSIKKIHIHFMLD
jgi:hypothetical protein